MKIAAEALLKKMKNVHWKSVDGEAVLLHFGTGDYFALDTVGTFLWSKINKGPVQFKELIETLSNEYTIPKEQVEGDVKEFCGQLLAEKLIEIKN